MLDDLLREAAAECPDAPAVRTAHGAWPYSALLAQARRIAAGLQYLGVGPGDRVAVLCRKSAEGLAALYGTLLAGATYVPLDPAGPPQRAKIIVDDCTARAVVGHDDLIASLEQLHPGCKAIALDGREASSARRLPLDHIPAGADAAEPPRDAQRLAYVLYTSGSTGSPKGVMISHAAARAFVDWALREFGVCSTDVLAGHAPWHFDISVFDIYVAAAARACLSPVPEHLSMFATDLGEWIRAAGITTWYSVPYPLVRLSELGAAAAPLLAGVRTILFAGEVFPPGRLSELMKAAPHPTYANLYGPTETNVCAFARVTSPPRDAIPIGRPIHGVNCQLRDGDRVVEGPGAQGELWVSGPTLADGYWGRPDLTADAFKTHDGRRSYRTGDICRWGPDGQLYFLGRRDGMVKIRGYRVETGEVEHVISAVPGVAESCVVALPDPWFGTRLCAVVAPAGVTVELVRAACRAALPPYSVPADVIAYEALPRTPTGKIDRRAVAASLRGNV